MIALSIFFLACGFLLLYRELNRDEDAPMLPDKISIIIPARNEERNLPRLLDSLKAREGEGFEVIVVDDDSEDGTVRVAEGMGARVISSGPLPEGWRGKSWACHQGAAKAEGEILLFIDADAWFAPGGLNRLRHLFASKPDHVLSVLPYHHLTRWHEQLSVFFNLLMAIGTGRFSVLPEARVATGLFGQSLMIRKEHYQRTGGYELVIGKILENFYLAEKLQSAGLQLTAMVGKGLLSFQMYPDHLRDLVAGWSKGFASGAQKTSPWLMLLIIAWLSGLIMAFSQFLGGAWALYLLAAVQVHFLARKVGEYRWITALLYPLPLFFFFAVFMKSSFDKWTGRQVSWKGRRMDAH